ncbi:hypothetical protein [Streptosporangium saharense]|uniref:hypothetical protein n=1 Tax=Streptosporangium saharense TaxID=1706840 RepID=UPI00343FCAB2
MPSGSGRSRSAAEQRFARLLVSRPQRLDRDALAAMLADLARKAKIYTSLGLRLIYHPGK